MRVFCVFLHLCKTENKDRVPKVQYCTNQGHEGCIVKQTSTENGYKGVCVCACVRVCVCVYTYAISWYISSYGLFCIYVMNCHVQISYHQHWVYKFAPDYVLCDCKWFWITYIQLEYKNVVKSAITMECKVSTISCYGIYMRC